MKNLLKYLICSVFIGCAAHNVNNVGCKNNDECFNLAIKNIEKEKQIDQSLNDLKKYCDEKHGKSCAFLAYLHSSGKLVEKDLKKAFFLAQKSCDLGEMAGCYDVGIFYDNALGGVKYDPFLANDYFEKACQNNHSKSCFNIATQYSTPNTLNTDFDKAKFFYDKSCKYGDSRGCYNLAMMFYNGQGGKKDYIKAGVLWQKACDGGDKDSCYAVGDMYLKGDGFKQDSTRAKKMFLNLCDIGHSESCVALSKMYIEGNGVKKDIKKGLKFLQDACKMGLNGACKSLENIKKNMKN